MNTDELITDLGKRKYQVLKCPGYKSKDRFFELTYVFLKTKIEETLEALECLIEVESANRSQRLSLRLKAFGGIGERRAIQANFGPNDTFPHSTIITTALTQHYTFPSNSSALIRLHETSYLIS